MKPYVHKQIDQLEEEVNFLEALKRG